MTRVEIQRTILIGPLDKGPITARSKLPIQSIKFLLGFQMSHFLCSIGQPCLRFELHGFKETVTDLLTLLWRTAAKVCVPG
jgi:hypothetical protein